MEDMIKITDILNYRRKDDADDGAEILKIET